MSCLEGAPVVVADQSLLHVEPEVRAGGQVHVPTTDTLHVIHEFCLTFRSAELLILEAIEVVVGNESKVA